MRANSSIMAAHFAENCARYLLVEDYAELESFLLKSAELSDIRRLQLCDPNGALIWDVSRSSRGQQLAKTGIARITPPSGQHAVITTENDLLVIWQPVIAGNMLGWLRADFCLSAIKEAQTRTWERTLLMSMAWIVCSALLVILVLRPIVRSIKLLTAFASQLNDRKGARITLVGQPLEITGLGTSLNEVSIKLLSSEQKLLDEQERLHKSEENYRRLAENSPDVIVRYDREGRRIYVNLEYERVNHISAQEVLGKKPAELSTELAPMVDVFSEKLMAAMASGDVTKVDLSWSKDGKPICWFVRVVPEFDANGAVVSALTIWSDISERKQIEDDIRQLNEELEQRVKLRTAELEEKNAELYKMNRLFVGRELRMVELKERIRELEGIKNSDNDTR
jgi:PAS domain S-box-containing protein